MIDGDGSICFSITSRNVIKATIDITTGSDTCLHNIEELYGKLCIEYSVRKTKSKAKKRLGRNKKKIIIISM